MSARDLQHLPAVPHVLPDFSLCEVLFALIQIDVIRFRSGPGIAPAEDDQRMPVGQARGAAAAVPHVLNVPHVRFAPLAPAFALPDKQSLSYQGQGCFSNTSRSSCMVTVIIRTHD